jgi:DNA polymerase-3 subunit alpha
MPAHFVHLRLHSEYSLVDGLVRLKPLLGAVAAFDMPAVAMTDDSNMFGLVKFQRASVTAGIKPIYGADVWLEPTNPSHAPTRLTLLAQTMDGYRHLTELVSEAYLTGQQMGKAIVKRQGLAEKNQGLIVLSGAKEGEIGQALLSDSLEEAERLLDAWLALFGDRFYLELQRTGRLGDEDCLHKTVALAAKKHCPVVATNDVRFIEKDDFEAHEVRVCIHEGRTLDDPRRPRHYSDQQYLRSAEEMIDLFSDVPEAVENTLEIAKRCTVDVPLGTYYLPNYPIPDGMTMNDFFRAESKKGLEERLSFLFDRNDPNFDTIRKPYDERLQIELDVIIQMGFPGYFLIVMDFIRWGKSHGVPVGPGRGSGAGSLVAYSLMITDLDPLEYDLLFERFLNPERVSMPDFDIDFCMDGRDRVIDYVAEHYGRDAVSQIITYGSMAAKAVVRDVGRVQGRSYGFVDRIAKLIPFDIGMTLTKAMEEEEQLKALFDDDVEVRELLEMALRLEGLTRNVGKHAGGVVIAPSKLTDFVPVYCDEAGANLVTQFDKDDVEAAGLVKFDFLGLRTLTIVDWALKTINADLVHRGEAPVEIERISLEDKQTFELLKAAETTAVFQLESRGMKDLIKRLQPSSFEDIVALVALFRPGPLQSGMVDDFINRKHGRAAVEYPHPDLAPILQNTYGVILYQEQVMQIAQVLAGYTLGGADMLRRAMGKKKPEEMVKQRVLFTEGALQRGVEEGTATYIFDLMEKFAGYGFNKSHSAAYALVSYQTAWLKAHYPAGFMAAVLSADMHNTDKIVTLVDECRSMKLDIAPPTVNTSAFKFTVDEEGRIVYGLGAIKGVGEGPIDCIVAARKVDGGFKDLFDFCRRIDARKVNRRCLEALIRSGAMDALGPSRAMLMASLNEAVKTAEQYTRNQTVGMSDLFGSLTDDNDNAPTGQFVKVRDWSDNERLSGEKETLGLYLTGHPVDQYQQELQHFTSNRIIDLKPNQRGSYSVIAGFIIAMRTMKNKRGDGMAFVTLDDKSGRIEVSVFSDVFADYRQRLQKDALLVVEGEVSFDDFSGSLKVNAKRLMDIAEARNVYAKHVLLRIEEKSNRVEQGQPDVACQLQQMLAPYKAGHCQVSIDYERAEVSARLHLGDEWRITPKEELLNHLRQRFGDQSVSVIYPS